MSRESNLKLLKALVEALEVEQCGHSFFIEKIGFIRPWNIEEIPEGDNFVTHWYIDVSETKYNSAKVLSEPEQSHHLAK